MSRWIAVVLGLVALTEPLTSARAQDDWSLTREAPRQSRKARATPKPVPDTARAPDLIERYWHALLQHPEDAFALDRLRELSLARDGSLEPAILRATGLCEAQPRDPRTRELWARLQLAAGHSEEALRGLDAALQAQPTAERLLGLRAELLLAAGRRAEARADYQSVASHAPRGEARNAALRALGELALADGDLETARARFADLAREKPDDLATRTAFAKALSARGRHAEAAQEYLSAARQWGADPRAGVPLLREAASAQLSAGDVASALDTLERARRIASPSLRAELNGLEVDAYRKAERLPELAERLEREGKAGRPEALFQAGTLWEELANDARALTCLRAHLSHAPRDLSAREHLTRVLARLGQLDELAAEYQRLAALAPSEPRYVVAWAELLREAGRREQALAVLDKASREASGSPAMHRALAELFARWNEPRRAEQELEKLTRLEPDDPGHVIALGEEAFARGDRKQAVQIWRRLVGTGGAQAEGHAALARVLGDHDLLDDALEHAGRAQELSPADPDTARLRASLLERAGRAADAEVEWQRVLSAERSDGEARREARQHIVGLWRRQGLTGRRLAEMEARLRSHPDDLEALRMLAELYAHEPSRADAELAALERIVRLDARDVEALRALERAHSRRGHVDEALRALDALVIADPGHASAHLARAVDLALASYRDDVALAYAQRALALRPDDAQVQRLVGDLYRRKQDLEQALSAYARAAELDPSDAEIRMTLAQLELARGHADAALHWWLSVITSARDEQLVARSARAAIELELTPTVREELERSLLNLALQHPERPSYRRLLVGAYADWFGPALSMARIGAVEGESLAALEQAGRRAIKPLVEALADADPLQRETALEMLGLVRAKNAGPALLALAEQGSASSERARALIAVGRLQDPALAPRLRALLDSVERRLKPFALWALVECEGARAADALLRQLADSDASLRMLAALEAGFLHLAQAEPVLAQWVDERHPSLSAAALWSLGQLNPASVREPCLRHLASAAPLGLVALLGMSQDDAALARGLFHADREVRSMAAALFEQPGAVAEARRPTPRWPFSAKEYLANWLRSDGRPAVNTASTRLVRAWPQVSATVTAALNDDSTASAVLGLLVPGRGGVVPAALAEHDPCLPDALARELARVIQPRLGALARRGQPKAVRVAALELLVRAGFPEHPAVLEALQDPADPGFEFALTALAGGSPTAEPVRARLLHAFDAAEGWPVRRKIAAVLGAELGPVRLAREPVEIVRAAAQLPHVPQNARSCGFDRFAN